MAKKSLLTPDQLRQLLRYEPETGKLFWRERPAEMFTPPTSAARWNTKFAGKEAFAVPTHDGYLRSNIGGRLYRAHRVAWAIYYGAWPPGDVDHLDGIRTNNRIGNLRDATKSVNQRNARMRSDNTSGFTGVSWRPRDRRWVARIKVGGIYQHLGYFENIEDAVSAREAAARGKGFTARHGLEAFSSRRDKREFSWGLQRIHG